MSPHKPSLISALPWPARVAASRLSRKVSKVRTKLHTRPFHDVPPTFRGDALGWSLEGDTLEVELHRDPCNEIGSVMLRELEELAAFIRGGARGARAMIFYSSAPRGFSAGADLRELYEGIVARRGAGIGRWRMAFEVRDFLDRIHEVFDTFDAAPITTIAAVHGFCFGGGFELALTCDEIIADKSARFAFPELRLGLVPASGASPASSATSATPSCAISSSRAEASTRQRRATSGWLPRWSHAARRWTSRGRSRSRPRSSTRIPPPPRRNS